MTIQIDGTEIGEAIAVASVVGSVVAFLIVALVVYLVVRPPRHRRRPVEASREPELDAEEMLALIDRMERRLEVLERAVGAEARNGQPILDAGRDPQLRRKQ